MTTNLPMMTMLRQARYSKEEFTRRGNEIYNDRIRPQIESSNPGKYIAIDIETGEWELDSDALLACDRLIARIPDSQTWLVRVGYPYLHRIGNLVSSSQQKSQQKLEPR